MTDVRRREFITLLGGAAASWPIAARAQQPAMPLIGFLHSASPETRRDQVVAFRQGLKDAGFVEGENVAIEYRWAGDQYDRLPDLAADLVRRRVAVIAATGNIATALAAKARTTTIPIVFMNSGDPVQAGLVASLNRPGGNITGVSNMAVELGAKQLGLLHELVPGDALIAVLVNPNSPITESFIADLRLAASAIGRQIEILTATTNREIDAAFAWSYAKTNARTRGRSRHVVPQPSRATHHPDHAPPGAYNASLSRRCRSWRADELRSK